MSYDRNKVIDLATSEVGYLEKSKSAYSKDSAVIYQKTAGAGYDNYTKYGYEMHQIYPSVMDFPAAWCDAFVDWCFYKAYGVTTAKSLLGGNFDDYTVESSKMYLKHNALDNTPKVGDQIFFTKNGKTSGCYHTGLVIAVNGNTVTTIEGNTSATGTGIEANGGGVAKRTRTVNKNTLFGHPNYGEGANTVGNYIVTTERDNLNVRKSAGGTKVTELVKGSEIIVDKVASGWARLAGFKNPELWVSTSYITKK